MKKKKINRKKKVQVPQKHGLGKAVEWVLVLCYAAIAVLFYQQGPDELVGCILIGSFIVSALYIYIYKGQAATDRAIDTACRFCISYMITMVALFFYVLAMLRAQQLTSTTVVFVLIGSVVVFYCIYTSTKGLMQRFAVLKDESKKVKDEAKKGLSETGNGESK